MNHVPWSTIDHEANGSTETTLPTFGKNEQGCFATLVGQGPRSTLTYSEGDRWMADMGDDERPVGSISRHAPYTFLPNSTNLGR